MSKLLSKIFSYEYLRKEHLQGFDKYKYSCIDSSPLSNYVMHPFWNIIVKIYPMWLAPNLITFVGFLCLILQFLLFTLYDYSLYGYCFNRDNCLPSNSFNLTERAAYFQLHLNDEFKNRQAPPSDVCSCIPRWLWLVLSVCQFLSHHLDGTDGKQARRTGSSTPLGELFDHGLDSWATLFLPVALVSIFGRSEVFGMSVYSMYGILWLILFSFIVSHWEKYNTGILFLPWSYDLSQIVRL
jgi:ethanolaminephosphotransferase